MSSDLHFSQNRAFRELYAATRQVANHWARLAERLDDPAARQALEHGASEAERLLRELADLTAKHELYGRPAAQGVGVNLAGARNRVGDLFLERNQAMRLAVLDAQHVTTLLGYLERIADTLEQETIRAFLARWVGDMRAIEEEAREAAIACGEAPDWAIGPLEQGPAGRAAHGAAYWMGTLGQWVDQRARGRRD